MTIPLKNQAPDDWLRMARGVSFERYPHDMWRQLSLVRPRWIADACDLTDLTRMRLVGSAS